jgi:tetratricopeptide (TPR) repeat protein
MHELANTHWYMADYDSAERLYGEVIQRRTRALGAEHPDTLLAMSDLASTYAVQKRWAEAEKLAQVVVASPLATTAARDVAVESLIDAHLAAQRLEQAEREAREWVAADAKRGGGQPLALRKLAAVCNQRGEYAEAEGLARRTVAILVPLLGEAHRNVLLTRLDLADALFGLGRMAEAEQQLRQVLEGEARLYGSGSDMIAADRWRLACVLLMLDKPEEARALIRENRESGAAGWTTRSFWRSRCDPLFAADSEISEILRQLGPAPEPQ